MAKNTNSNGALGLFSNVPQIKEQVPVVKNDVPQSEPEKVIEKVYVKSLGRKKYYEQPHFIRLCVEEKDYIRLAELAEEKCGGNVNKFVYRILSAYLNNEE